MALLDDLLKGKAATAVGLSVVALAVPVIFPALRPQWAALVKSGARLFFEAELGADNEIMDRLVDATVDGLLAVMSGGSEEDRKRAAEAEVHAFKAMARARAHRKGWDEADRQARYHRHVSNLRYKVSCLRSGESDSNRVVLEHVVDHLTESTAPTA